jgi:hypothetical protein
MTSRAVLSLSVIPDYKPMPCDTWKGASFNSRPLAGRNIDGFERQADKRSEMALPP